jgi:phage-related protein
MSLDTPEKPLHWIGSSKEDLLEFPRGVVRHVGYDLNAIQLGKLPASAKPWKGQGSGVFEIVQDDRHGTYRAVYTLRFAKAVYVLHVFQKKSPSGARTARTDVALIARRLSEARKDYEQRYGQEKAKSGRRDG